MQNFGLQEKGLHTARELSPGANKKREPMIAHLPIKVGDLLWRGTQTSDETKLDDDGAKKKMPPNILGS